MLEDVLPGAAIYRGYGDSFTCLIEEPLGFATAMARKIADEVCALSIDVERKTSGGSASVAVAHVPTHAADDHELYSVLHRAIQEAKFRGCGQIIIAQNENAP